jgi:hypothetical protein
MDPLLLPSTKFHAPARRKDAKLRHRLVAALKQRLRNAA